MIEAVLWRVERKISLFRDSSREAVSREAACTEAACTEAARGCHL